MVVQNLMSLTQGANYGESTSLEEMMGLLVRGKFIPAPVVKMLWDIFTHRYMYIYMYVHVFSLAVLVYVHVFALYKLHVHTCTCTFSSCTCIYMYIHSVHVHVHVHVCTYIQFGPYHFMEFVCILLLAVLVT